MKLKIPIIAEVAGKNSNSFIDNGNGLVQKFLFCLINQNNKTTYLKSS